MTLRTTAQLNKYAASVLTICIALLVMQTGVEGQEQDELRYTTPSGITCIITADGLSSVQTPDRVLADGVWQLQDVGEWAKKPRIPSVTPPDLSLSAVRERSLSVLDAERARVEHVYDDLTVTYHYIFDREDLRIVAHVENRHKKADLRAVRFGGLRFAFRDVPQGVMGIHTKEEVEEMGFDAFHPSQNNPIGGSCAACNELGVGLAPGQTGVFPDLVSWQLERFNDKAGFRLSWSEPSLIWWEPTAQEHAFNLHYVESSPVKAEGARRYQLSLRFSDNTDWKHLLEPWKRELAASYGNVRYESPSRPIAYHPVRTRPVQPAEGSGTTMWNGVPGAFGEVAEEYKNNPLGYAEGEIRFDRSEAVRKFVDQMAPALREAEALGIIFRQIGGHDPKGLEYGAMFHMAPDRVHDNIKKLVTDRLSNAHQLVGLAGRPDRYPVYTSLDRCKWLPLSPDIRKHLSHMWSCRFRLTSIDKIGARMFLLEDFGNGPDDVRIMRHLRHKMDHGQKMQDFDKSIHSFAEYPSDAMLFFSPGYTRVYDENGEIASDLERRTGRILRWLVPGAGLYGLVESRDPAIVKEIANDLYSRGLGAIVYDEVFPQVAPALGEAYRKSRKSQATVHSSVEEPVRKEEYPFTSSKIEEASENGEMTYTTEEGIQLRVTASGLESISMADRTLAEGTWRTLSPSDRFGENSIQERLFHKTGPHSCRVVHRHDKMRTTFDYSFAGEDVVIRARVENNHPTVGINITTFGALTFHFRGQPNKRQWTSDSKWGWLPHPDPHKGLRHMHPGRFNRLAGCYGADEEYGVGATPMHTGFTRTLINWEGGWGSKDRRLTYSAEKPIPPGGARTFYLRLRLSTNRDWKHLLQPYRDYFQSLHGLEPRYNVDHRFVIQRMAGEPAGDHWKSKSSPLAFHEKRRLDTPAGARRWAQSAVDTLKKAAGKGLIMWAQCGYQPRKMRFRTDFDLLPEPVEKSWPSFRKVFEEGEKRIGVAVGRTYAMNYRWKWNKDNILPRPVSMPYLQAMGQRFKNMMDRGVTMFYLDVFGYHLGDIKAMRYYREHVLGPDVLTYSEGPLTDAILPYSGLRTGIRHSRKKGLHLYWGQGRVYYIMQWLMTDFGSQTYARLHPMPQETFKVGEELGTELKHAVRLEKEHIYRWMFRHRMGVMDLWPSDNYRDIQEEFLTPEGQWREDLPPMDRPGEDRYKQELRKKAREEQKEKATDDIGLDILDD